MLRAISVGVATSAPGSSISTRASGAIHRHRGVAVDHDPADDEQEHADAGPAILVEDREAIEQVRLDTELRQRRRGVGASGVCAGGVTGESDWGRSCCIAIYLFGDIGSTSTGRTSCGGRHGDGGEAIVAAEPTPKNAVADTGVDIERDA